MSLDKVGEVGLRKVLDGRGVVVLFLDECQLCLESRIELLVLAVFLLLLKLLEAHFFNSLQLILTILLVLIVLQLSSVELFLLDLEQLLGLFVGDSSQSEGFLPIGQIIQKSVMLLALLEKFLLQLLVVLFVVVDSLDELLHRRILVLLQLGDDALLVRLFSGFDRPLHFLDLLSSSLLLPIEVLLILGQKFGAFFKLCDLNLEELQLDRAFLDRFPVLLSLLEKLLDFSLALEDLLLGVLLVFVLFEFGFLAL